MTAMIFNGGGSKRNEQFPQRTFHRCFLPRFGSFGKAVSEKKISRNRPIRNKNCLRWPYLLMDRDEMSNLYGGPPIDESYQVSVHLTKRFPRRFFFKSTNQKQEFSMVAMFVNEMSNLNRGPSIDASYPVSVHKAKRFQIYRRII